MTKLLVEQLSKQPDLVFFNFGASAFFKKYNLGLQEGLLHSCDKNDTLAEENMELLALIGSTETGTEAQNSQQNDREDSLPVVQEFALDKILEKFP